MFISSACAFEDRHDIKLLLRQTGNLVKGFLDSVKHNLKTSAKLNTTSSLKA